MSAKSDSRELNELLKQKAEEAENILFKQKAKYINESEDCPGTDAIASTGGYCQWSTSDGKRFVPSSKTAQKLIPGVYDIQSNPNVGTFFEQIPILTTGLIRFPETNSDKVVSEIQKFWKKEDTFKEYNLTYKRGIILWGPPGCHAAGTEIIMFDGSKKKVEDIIVGDSLMGPDSNPRKVLELRHGFDEMYKITPVKGESFVVNGHHILNLVMSHKRERRFPPVMNISVNDYMGLTQCSRRSFKLHRVGVDFHNNFNLPIDPYFLGVWLGDGTTGNTQIASADFEIKDYLIKYAESLGLSVSEYRKTDSICFSYTIVGNGKKKGNILRSMMQDMQVLDNKFIPKEYMLASRSDRLKLLAGLVDTDGGYTVSSWRKNQKFKKKGYKGFFEIIQKSSVLADQIVSLARSLGFGVTTKKVKKSIKRIDFVGEYHRINIFGNIAEIPVLIKRKKALVGVPNKDPLRTGIGSIESLGKGEYFGFTLSGDHLYLTSDYMVHHNSGKSATIQIIMRDVVDRGGVVIKFTHPGLFIDGIRKFREIQPTTPVVVLMEDIDSILEQYCESEVLNILDGVNQIEKVCYLATTNYPEKLGARIINRPSRFDKRFKIGHPNAESRRIYFEYIIGKDKIKDLKIDIDRWVQDTEDFSIAHLKELFTAVVVFGDSYEEAIESLSLMKEDKPDSAYDEPKNMGFGVVAKKAQFVVPAKKQFHADNPPG